MRNQQPAHVYRFLACVFFGKPVGMNIPVDPPRFSRPSQRVPSSLPQVPLAALSLPATQALNQPVQRTRPPGLPTVGFYNPPVRPFRAHGTVRHPAASDATGSRHPHAQALAREPSGPERASLRVSRPLQGASRRPTDAHSGSIHRQSGTRSGTRRVSGSARIMPDPDRIMPLTAAVACAQACRARAASFKVRLLINCCCRLRWRCESFQRA